MTQIPFIIGILVGYLCALVFTLIGKAAGNASLQILDFSAFSRMQWMPDFTFLKAFKGMKEISGQYVATIAVAYVPVAFVVFAEHIADHKNLSTIIGHELLEDPGLHRTLLGDGVGSIAGAFFGAGFFAGAGFLAAGFFAGADFFAAAFLAGAFFTFLIVKAMSGLLSVRRQIHYAAHYIKNCHRWGEQFLAAVTRREPPRDAR